MAEEIKIVASAVGFDQVNKALDSTTKSLEETSQAATQAGKTLGNQLKAGSGQAQQSITNLNRVIQDAPFGFIGIANNINPLVESFGRLKAESGSVGGALKSLIGGLSGPAGLGLAFAVVTSAISFAQMGLSRWGVASKKAKEETDKFAEGLRSAEQGAIAQGVRLEGLTKIITNSAASERDRNLALAEANKLLEPYGKKIDSLNISVAKAKELTDAYTEALINQAVGAKLADKIAELRIRKVEILNQLELQRSVIAGAAAKKTAEANALTTRQYGTSDRAALQYLQTTTDVTVEQEKLVGINAELVAVQKQLNGFTDQYNATVTQTLKIDKERAKTAGETLPQAIAKFERSLIAIQATGLSLGTPQFEINNDKIKEFENFLKKIIEKFNVNPNNKIYLGFEGRLNELQYTNLIQKIQDKINAQPLKALLNFDSKKLPELPAKIKVKSLELPSLEDIQTSANLANLFSFLPTNFFKPFSEDTLLSIRKTFTEGFESIAEDVAILFGQTLGDALTGQASIGDFFKGIFASLGANLEALGKFLVKTAIEIELIQKTLFTNPFLAIAGGIALIAIGRAISNATNRNAFAVGTRYAPGGMALVGERGPEMINLPRGSQVIPAAQTSQMMGGIGGAIEVFGMLRGQDIYFSNKKYGQTYKRTT